MVSSSTSAWCFDVFHTSSIFHLIYQDINISTHACREVLVKHQVSCKLTFSLGRSPYVSVLMDYLSHSCHVSWIGLVARAMLEVGSLLQSPLNCLCTGQRLFWGLLKGRWISWVLNSDKVCPRVHLINWGTGWRVTKSSMSWTALLCQLLILLYEPSTQRLISNNHLWFSSDSSLCETHTSSRAICKALILRNVLLLASSLIWLNWPYALVFGKIMSRCANNVQCIYLLSSQILSLIIDFQV